MSSFDVSLMVMIWFEPRAEVLTSVVYSRLKNPMLYAGYSTGIISSTDVTSGTGELSGAPQYGTWAISAPTCLTARGKVRCSNQTLSNRARNPVFADELPVLWMWMSGGRFSA